MKRVSSSSVGSHAKRGTYAVTGKPSVVETVKKYGGILNVRDGNVESGMLEFRNGTVIDPDKEKSAVKEDIFLNGKLFGSKG